ncbi:hypothetical protein ACFQX6_50295 [Streptosporangium lutulentum]
MGDGAHGRLPSRIEVAYQKRAHPVLGRWSGCLVGLPCGVEIADRENAVVTLAHQSGSRRRLLSVPVFYDSDTKRSVVSGHPARAGALFHGRVSAGGVEARGCRGEPRAVPDHDLARRTACAVFSLLGAGVYMITPFRRMIHAVQEESRSAD